MKCKHMGECGSCYILSAADHFEYCVQGPCPHEAPMTNADRIRAMSDEELADWLMSEAPKLVSTPIWCKGGCEDEENCTHERDCVKNWLSQPVEED